MTPPADRIRWTDMRLDDRFDTITGELRALRDMPAKLATLRGDVQRVQADTSAFHSALRELRDELSEYIEDQHKAQESLRLERKSDRRWMVGSVFTAAGLIIAAVSLLVGHIG